MMMPNDYFVGMGWRNQLCKMSSGQLVDLGCRLMSGFRNPALRLWFQRVPLDTELSEKHVLVLHEDEVGAASGISLLNYMMMVLLSVMAGLLALKSPSGNMGRRQWDSNDLSQPFKALLWIQWSVRMKQFHESSPILKTSHLFCSVDTLSPVHWHMWHTRELISKIGACFVTSWKPFDLHILAKLECTM